MNNNANDTESLNSKRLSTFFRVQSFYSRGHLFFDIRSDLHNDKLEDILFLFKLRYIICIFTFY